MSEIRTFFRHCPSCGRRFEVRLESKKLLKDQTVTTMLNASEAAVKDALIAGPAPPAAPVPTLMGQGEPVIVDVETFQYTYKCKHCGHEWSEVREEEHAEKS
ncbi:MAG: hypothetical protein OK456_05580 [Thaumarchaeota archaeon]|nr:hypothetical protein [Nitrososphaerota archaeon]